MENQKSLDRIVAEIVLILKSREHIYGFEQSGLSLSYRDCIKLLIAERYVLDPADVGDLRYDTEIKWAFQSLIKLMNNENKTAIMTDVVELAYRTGSIIQAIEHCLRMLQVRDSSGYMHGFSKENTAPVVIKAICNEYDEKGETNV